MPTLPLYPATAEPGSPPAVTLDLERLPGVVASALYVHIPFCVHKCHYCDFYSITGQSDDRLNAFVDRLFQEADLWIGGRHAVTVRPRTVFFGGGTPTLLPPAAMRRLLDGLASRFDFSAVVEWTCECNPATVRESYGRDYLTLLRDGGVNRLSFGVQSFEEAHLKTLERHHRAGDVDASVVAARECGFDRLNLDLIYGIPGQTLLSWQQTLEQAIAFGTEHLSCYNLTYEPNTAMTARKDRGQFRPADEATELRMFHHTRQRLAEAGLPPYEVSNYARPGAACRHNLAYWKGESYVSLGPAAASHLAGVRWKNRPHLSEWETAVAMGSLPATDVEYLTPRQRSGELAMLRLRLADGIDLVDFRERTGEDLLAAYGPMIDRYVGVGLLEKTDSAVRLTERGWDVADAIAGEFV